MRSFFQFALLLAALFPCSAMGLIVERIVATVNGRPVLQSDWDEAVRYEAFADQRPLDAVSRQERKATLDRLVDQLLLREQMKDSDFDHATVEQVAKGVGDIRSRYSDAVDEGAWKADLQSYGLTEKDIARHVRLQINLDRLIEVRLRPSIHIDPTSVEAYYREQLVPELRKAGARVVTLVEVSPKIEELLTQKKIDELLTSWLRDLRVQSNIQMDGAVGITPQ